MEPENLRRSWGRIRTTAGLAAVDVAVRCPGRINPPGPARGARPPNPQRDMAMLASYLGEAPALSSRQGASSPDRAVRDKTARIADCKLATTPAPATPRRMAKTNKESVALSASY
jgi:hypothetical protein